MDYDLIEKQWTALSLKYSVLCSHQGPVYYALIEEQCTVYNALIAYKCTTLSLKNSVLRSYLRTVYYTLSEKGVLRSHYWRTVYYPLIEEHYYIPFEEQCSMFSLKESVLLLHTHNVEQYTPSLSL